MRKTKPHLPCYFLCFVSKLKTVYLTSMFIYLSLLRQPCYIALADLELAL